MARPLLSTAVAGIFVGATLAPSFAQETTQPSVQPVPILAGQSGGAGTSGGVTSGSVPAEALAPAAVEPAQPLAPGPAAGEQQASFLSSPVFIGGAAAATALIVCAIVCFNHSTTSTTSTGVTAH